MKTTMIKNMLIVLLLVAAIPSLSYAQCKSFSKNQCQPRIKPYDVVEQSHTTTLLSGDKTEVVATFYQGEQYRLIICGDNALGKLTLNLKDKDNKVVYTASGYGTIMWDFSLENTQELSVEIVTPEGAGGDGMDKSGCVSFLLGLKL